MALIKVKERGRETVNLGRRNLIINGDMRIAQRSTAAVQAGNGTYDTVDRMMTWSVAGGGTFTGSQSTGHQLATGHDTAYKVDVTSADTSIASGDYYEFLQRIEAKNLQHLCWGTAAAKKLQVSFWVRATKTGIQSLFVSKQGTGTAYRNVINYTINATDTWEYKTLEVPALTASSIANDSATYLQVGFILGMGSGFHVGTAGTWTTGSLYSTANTVNHMDSTSNDFYVTGLQVEVGDTATDFEHRPIGEELSLCERYFQTYSNRVWQGTNEHAANYFMYFDGVFRQKMRAAPTATIVGTVTLARPQVAVTQRPTHIQGLSDEGFTKAGWATSGTYGGQLGSHGDAYYRMAVGAGPANQLQFSAEL